MTIEKTHIKKRSSEEKYFFIVIKQSKFTDEEMQVVYSSRSTILEIPQWRDDIVIIKMENPLEEFYI
jgi:hypothetical protein